MTKADELWDRFCYGTDGSQGEFIAALKEYGAAVRARDAADDAELQYWRNCNADIMRRKSPVDCLSHADRIADIRMRAAAIEREPLP